MRLNIATIVMLFPLIAWGQSNMLDSLQNLRWQHRIIIVHTDDEAQSKKVLEQLQYYEYEVNDRDIVWFINIKGELLSNTTFSLAPKLQDDLSRFDKRSEKNAFSAVLIGKDGGVKDRQHQWNIDSIFALIDTMPMRQREMAK